MPERGGYRATSDPPPGARPARDTGLPLAVTPLEGRFCPEDGGELRHVRQRKGSHLITYLVCQMALCNYSLPLMDFDEKTGETTNLLPARKGDGQ